MRLVVLTCLLVSMGFFYPENPPPAHTGGFGEPTCHACHFDGELNAGGGSLELLGLGAGYRAKKPMRLKIRLAQEKIVQAGVQLSVRFDEGDKIGEQAGSLEPVDDRLAIDLVNDVEYLRHTTAGAEVATDSVVWTFVWNPPEIDEAVVFHLAGNAANGDDYEFGDEIYTLEKRTAPMRP